MRFRSAFLQSLTLCGGEPGGVLGFGVASGHDADESPRLDHRRSQDGNVGRTKSEHYLWTALLLFYLLFAGSISGRHDVRCGASGIVMSALLFCERAFQQAQASNRGRDITIKGRRREDRVLCHFTSCSRGNAHISFF
jgi:hypothetical protein